MYYSYVLWWITNLKGWNFKFIYLNKWRFLHSFSLPLCSTDALKSLSKLLLSSALASYEDFVTELQNREVIHCSYDAKVVLWSLCVCTGNKKLHFLTLKYVTVLAQSYWSLFSCTFVFHPPRVCVGWCTTPLEVLLLGWVHWFPLSSLEDLCISCYPVVESS